MSLSSSRECILIEGEGSLLIEWGGGGGGGVTTSPCNCDTNNQSL